MTKLWKNKDMEHFPDSSEEVFIQEFQGNIGPIKEIQIIVGPNKCILPLLIAMGPEPNVGILIAEMFI